MDGFDRRAIDVDESNAVDLIPPLPQVTHPSAAATARFPTRGQSPARAAAPVSSIGSVGLSVDWWDGKGLIEQCVGARGWGRRWEEQ